MSMLQPSNMNFNQLLQSGPNLNQPPQFQQNFVAQTTQNFTAAAPITTQINSHGSYGNITQDPSPPNIPEQDASSNLQYKGASFQFQAPNQNQSQSQN